MIIKNVARLALAAGCLTAIVTLPTADAQMGAPSGYGYAPPRQAVMATAHRKVLMAMAHRKEPIPHQERMARRQAPMARHQAPMASRQVPMRRRANTSHRRPRPREPS